MSPYHKRHQLLTPDTWCSAAPAVALGPQQLPPAGVAARRSPGRPGRAARPRPIAHRRDPRRGHGRDHQGADGAHGHTSPGVALRYQHVMADRQAALAAALDDLARDATTAAQAEPGGHVGARPMPPRRGRAAETRAELGEQWERVTGVEPASRAWKAQPTGRVVLLEGGTARSGPIAVSPG